MPYNIMWNEIEILGLNNDSDALGISGSEYLEDISKISIEQDLRWLQGITKDSSNSWLAFVTSKDLRVQGYAPIFVHASDLQFCLGEVTFYTFPIQRYQLSNPILNENAQEQAVGENSSLSFCLEELFNILKSVVPARGVLFLHAIPISSHLYMLLNTTSKIHSIFHVIPYGPMYQRRTILLLGTFNDYLKELSSKTRQDLKRTKKKFQEKVGSAWQLVRIDSSDQINEFLAKVEQISKKTYQWKLLGLGVCQNSTHEKQMYVAANYGWLKCYLLMVDEQPIAFQIGYDYQGTYLAHDIGYDPTWAKLQVGIFLHTQIIEDLLNNAPHIKKFDFLLGDSVHKERLSTHSHQERHFYLIPRTFKNFFLAKSFSGINKFSSSIGIFLAKYNLKNVIKKKIRRHC